MLHLLDAQRSLIGLVQAQSNATQQQQQQAKQHVMLTEITAKRHLHDNYLQCARLTRMYAMQCTDMLCCIFMLL